MNSCGELLNLVVSWVIVCSMKNVELIERSTTGFRFVGLSVCFFIFFLNVVVINSIALCRMAEFCSLHDFSANWYFEKVN